MALSKTVETPQGFTATDAYHRVENVSITKTHVAFQLVSYMRPDKPSFKHYAFSAPYDINGENPIRQAYVYLQTLPEWADASSI